MKQEFWVSELGFELHFCLIEESKQPRHTVHTVHRGKLLVRYSHKSTEDTIFKNERSQNEFPEYVLDLSSHESITQKTMLLSELSIYFNFQRKNIDPDNDDTLQQILWAPVMRRWYVVQSVLKLILELFGLYCLYLIQLHQNPGLGFFDVWTIPGRVNISTNILSWKILFTPKSSILVQRSRNLWNFRLFARVSSAVLGP